MVRLEDGNLPEALVEGQTVDISALTIQSVFYWMKKLNLNAPNVIY